MGVEVRLRAMRDVVRGLSGCALVLAVAATIAGCAGSRGGPIAYDRADFVAPDVQKFTDVSERRLGPGDVVTVSVFQVDALSGDHEVDSSGRIQLPLLGVVDVAGKTVGDVSTDLSARYGATYLKAPKVQVSLKSAHEETVTVDGSVKQPGVYPIAGKTTLMEALALAHGTDQSANDKRVVVFRTISGKREAASFDLSTIRKGQDVDPEIYRNDIIVVDGSKSRQAFRDFLSTVPLLTLFRPF